MKSSVGCPFFFFSVDVIISVVNNWIVNICSSVEFAR